MSIKLHLRLSSVAIVIISICVLAVPMTAQVDQIEGESLCQRIALNWPNRSIFLRDFQFRVHAGGQCSEQNSERTDLRCTHVARKRLHSPVIYASGYDNSNIPSTIITFAQVYQKIAESIQKTTQFDFIPPDLPPTEFPAYQIQFLLVDPIQYHADEETYISNFITLNGLMFANDRRVAFENFVDSPLQCGDFSLVAGDNEIIHSQIWLKSNTDPLLTAQCAVIHLYTSFGVGDGAIEKSNTFNSPANSFGDQDQIRREVALELLYTAGITPGMTETQTLEKADAFLKDKCRV